MCALAPAPKMGTRGRIGAPYLYTPVSWPLFMQPPKPCSSTPPSFVPDVPPGRQPPSPGAPAGRPYIPKHYTPLLLPPPTHSVQADRLGAPPPPLVSSGPYLEDELGNVRLHEQVVDARLHQRLVHHNLAPLLLVRRGERDLLSLSL